MAVVPDKVLKWLYNILTTDYHDPPRTYADVASSLSHYSTLAPRTDVYTFENGTSALLLLLAGTIPVPFRGTHYRFPVSLWVPHEYPRRGPMVYVTPPGDMLIRPGQHVAGDGRVYHPYLAQWESYWDKSSIKDFLDVLRDVFAKEPPVISKQQAQAVPKPAAPPPVPPPPEEYRRSLQPQPSPVATAPEASKPPPLPPKADGSHVHTPPPVVSTPPVNSSGPPPIPPIPRGHSVDARSMSPTQWQMQGPSPMQLQYGGGTPQRQSSLSVAQGMSAPMAPHSGTHHELETPAGTMPPRPSQQSIPPQFPQAQPQFPQYQHQQPYLPASVTHQHSQGISPPFQSSPLTLQQPSQPPKPKAPPPMDLLTSLDDAMTIPTPLPAPPIPPNPEKDALLQALSQSLTTLTNQQLQTHLSTIPPLQSQHTAMLHAQSALTSELDSLNALSSAIDSNEATLRDTIARADAVMRDAAGRTPPDVDELLVCPTVVGGQLYGLVADERACKEVRGALCRGLDRGRVGVEVWVKQMRGVAREEFLKKVLIAKIAAGMGLEGGTRGR